MEKLDLEFDEWMFDRTNNNFMIYTRKIYIFCSSCNFVLTTGCSLNIVFFPKILKYYGLWPFSVFPRCQCVYTYQAGRKQALQQNWQSSEKSQIFKIKTQYLMNTLYNIPERHMIKLCEIVILSLNLPGWAGSTAACTCARETTGSGHQPGTQSQFKYNVS